MSAEAFAIDANQDGRELLSDYLATRRVAMTERTDDLEAVSQIQSDTQNWIKQHFSPQTVDYASFSIASVKRKMLGLADHLIASHSDHVRSCEVLATQLFIDASFTMYDESLLLDDNRLHPDADGAFAFVVPMRVSRFRGDYGGEVELISPILRYIPNEYRAMFAVGLPPLVLDTYAPGPDGRRGYLVLAPIFTDSMFDIPDRAAGVALANINAAVDFAYRRLGAEVIGLGAVLPALTRFGRSIQNQNVITTTGHGGTVSQIDQAIRVIEAERREGPESPVTIGFLGLGSIGRSAAEVITGSHPEAKIAMFDTRSSSMRNAHRLLESVGRTAIACENELDLVGHSDIIVSAITSTVDLDPYDIDLTGKFIVDDSQPSSFNRAQVESRGGRVAWVVARDTQHLVTRDSYNYGPTADPYRDLFGCEAEAASLARYDRELRERGLEPDVAKKVISRVALRAPVTARDARRIGELFRRYGIVSAPFQIHGEYLSGI